MPNVAKVMEDSAALEEAVQETVSVADQTDAVDLNEGITSPEELEEHFLKEPMTYEKLEELVSKAKKGLGNDGQQ